MGFLPRLNDITPTRDMVMGYTGYNHNLITDDQSFYNEQNMSSSLYPVLSQRPKRARVRAFARPHGLLAHDRKLAWVDGTSFYYDGSNTDGSDNAMTVSDTDKQMISMGAYILIWPDKKYYNTKTQEFGSLEVSATYTSVDVTPSLRDGSQITPTVAASPPSNPSDGAYWVDTSQSPHVLKRYSTTLSMWSPISTVYTKITATGIGDLFNEWDGVTIEGAKKKDLNGDFVIYDKGTDYIVVVAMLDSATTWNYTGSTKFSIKRSIPDMDFVTENENRIWGCSSENHEIYACALGDPFNWHKYLGTSTDSYALTVGSGGKFTGAITHLGYVLFFKEDVIHRLYGNKPANYQLANINARGVRENSSRSTVIVNETLFYHSKFDVCGFTSSLPQNISDNLGAVKYVGAVAGTDSSKYYISLQDESGKWSLFTFDMEKSIWHREDDTHMLWTANIGTDMYYISEDRYMYSVNGNVTDYADLNALMEEDVEWMVETGPIGVYKPDHQWITKIQIRYETDLDAEMEVFMQYDNSQWERQYLLANPQRLGTDNLTILPHRCDTARLRIKGKGGVRIFSITQTIEGASDK